MSGRCLRTLADDLDDLIPNRLQIYVEVLKRTGSDTFADVVVVNGAEGSGGNTMLINRGDRESNLETLDVDFAWDAFPINYLVGPEASRIEIAHLESF